MVCQRLVCQKREVAARLSSCEVSNVKFKDLKFKHEIFMRIYFVFLKLFHNFCLQSVVEIIIELFVLCQKNIIFVLIVI